MCRWRKLKIRGSKLTTPIISARRKEVSNDQGAIVWQGNYDEYGKVKEVVAQTEQNIRFQGQYEDVETGLFYNRFRYYDASDCRFISQDPIHLAGDFNIYAYCQNPVNWLDPFGLWEFMNGATATITAGENSETFHSSPSGHAEMNGLNSFAESGRLNGQHVVISNVTGEFNGGVTKPVGVCSGCRTDIFSVLQQGGATGVTIPITRGNKLQGTVSIESSQFASVRRQLESLRRRGLSNRQTSDEAWEILERHGKVNTC